MIEIPTPKSIEWKQVTKGIHVNCTATETIDFALSTPPFQIAQGETFSGVYKGWTIDDDDKIFRPYFYIEERQRTFGIQPNLLKVSLVDSRYCFRCGMHCPIADFQRHALVEDKSPILSQVCSDCYRRVKNKVAEHRSIARSYGGDISLLPSEWLEKLLASEGKCHYCKEHIGYTSLIIEHMTPLSLRGGNTKENVVPACQSCNSSKGGRDVATWQRHMRIFHLTKHLQKHLGLSKFEVTNMAIELLAQREGLLLEDNEMDGSVA